MGRGIERAPRGSRVIERRGRTTAHYMEGLEGRPSRYREFRAAANRPQRPHARRQPCSFIHFERPNHTVTFNDGGTKTYVVLTRHEQHQPRATLHPLGS
jgi:hypothetical protein